MSLAASAASRSSHGAAERAADRFRGPRGVRHRPADDRHVMHALRFHVHGGELAHFAGADHHHAAALQVAEDLFRERDRREADRHGARSEPGLGPHPLADAERRVEQPVQDRADRAGVRGGGVRLLHLPENLRLANDERVEPGGDPEQVSRRVEVGALVDVRHQRRSIDAMELGDEPDELGACAVALIAGGIQLGAVAGRQDDGLARSAALVPARAAPHRARAPGNRSARAARPAPSDD